MDQQTTSTSVPSQSAISTISTTETGSAIGTGQSLNNQDSKISNEKQTVVSGESPGNLNSESSSKASQNPTISQTPQKSMALPSTGNSLPTSLPSNSLQEKNNTSLDPSTASNKAVDSSAEDSDAKNTSKKRDRTMAEFVLMMDQYAPIIPDLCTDYYLTQAGFDCDDYRVKRVLALATQKFVSDIATDAYQYAKMRNQAPKDRKSGKGKKVTLTMDDLSPALSEYGINVKKPDYYL